MGLIMTSISAAIMVILSQQDNAEGRLDNAVSAQSLSRWLPADMASAETYDVTPSASPCGSVCPLGITLGGSNAMMASWNGISVVSGIPVTTITNVSYRYLAAGTTWNIVRVACTKTGKGGWQCKQSTAMSDVPAPPPGTTFVAGTTSPVWALEVQPPMKPDAIAGTDTVDPTASKNGQRVIVNVDGGGEPGGASGGGSMTFSVSAGSTMRTTMDADSNVRIPSFTEAVSRCGGNMGLIIDSSGSISPSAMNLVNSGVKTLIDTFSGTPMKLQVVDFDGAARLLGGRYYDMLVPADVTALKTAVNGIRSGGGTNWEDGIYSMFYRADGTFQQRLPDKVLFFTDGQPIGDRLSARLPLAVAHPDDWWVPQNSLQRAFNRSLRAIAPLRTSAKFIGVGVGSNIEPGRMSSLLTKKDYRRVNNVKVYSPPYTHYDIVNVPTLHTAILTELITGDPNASVVGTLVDGKYTNSDVADMYILPQWDQFAEALKAIGLADCGGTLTMQTFESGVTSMGSFEYANTKLTTPGGLASTPNPGMIVTDEESPSGTLDFTVGGNPSVYVEMTPTITTTMKTLYRPVPVAGGSAWLCSAGGQNRTFTEVPLSGESLWKGIAVRVASNEAVSCVLNVAPA
ncbi:MAG: vWA domain-containing protein [Ilumatobacteraceae bacterium]